MLDWNPDKRKSAQEMLSHPWLTMNPSYETKKTDEELSEYLARQQALTEIMDPPMHGEEMSKHDETDTEINCGDRETNGITQLQEIDEVLDNESSDEEDDISTEANSLKNPKELRDIAEGKNLNNSFIGSSYPENWDHLHFGKGSNPQFQYLEKSHENNNIFELAGRMFGLI